MKNKIRMWFSWPTGYFLVGLVITLAFVLAPTAKVLANGIITFTNQTGNYGDTLNVPLTASNYSSLVGGMDFNFSYNTDLISYVGYSNGALTGSGSLTTSSISNVFTINWHSGSLSLSDTTTLLTLDFTVATTTVDTSASLTFGGTQEVSDPPAENVLDTTYINGTLTLNPLSAPTATSTITFENVSASSITVNWTEVGDATSYDLYYGNDVLVTTTGATTYNDTGLDSNTTYTYYVIASNDAGDGPASSDFSTTTLVSIPDTPSVPTFSNVASTALTVNWDAVSGATYYVLYQDDVSVVTTSVTSSNRSGLSASTTYVYTLKAGNAGGLSATSDSATTTTLPGAPDAPSVPTITNVVSSSLTVSWSDVANALNYRLYENGSLVTTTVATTSNRTSLTPSTSYTYYVLAGNAGGWSASSTAVSTTTLPLPPSAPSAPTFTNVASSSLIVSWTAVSGVTYYELYEDDILVDTTVATTSQRSSLASDTLFSYYVIAGNSGGESASSSVATVSTLPLPPDAPAVPDITDLASSSLTVSWTDVDGATSYKLYENDVLVDTTVVTTSDRSSLTPNTSYTYYVLAGNTGGWSASSSEAVTTTPATLPTSPTVSLLTATTLTLTWGANGNSGTTVYEVSSPDNSFVSVTTTAVFKALSGLTPNSEYTFTVKAYDIGLDDYNEGTDADTTSTPAALPTSPTVSLLSTSTLTISWGANSNPSTTIYQVSGNNSFTSVTTTSSTKSLAGLTPNLSYTFTVKAYSTGLSAYNAGTAASATTTIPVNVTLPVASLVNTSTLTLSWTDSINSSTPVYQISGDNDFTSVTTTDLTEDLTGLIRNTEYTFTIKVQKPNTTWTTGTDITTTTLDLPPGVTVSESDLAVTEGGTTDTYTVVLDGQPTADVVITITVSGDKIALSTNTLTFTSENYRDPQTITVTADNDAVVEGAHSDTITHSASSSDENYEGIEIADVAVTITDNDSRGGGGGGGGDTTPPTNTSIKINGNVASTNNVNVQLTLGASGATLMTLSNSSDFSNAVWESYVTSKNWTLTSGAGIKTVYVKFRDNEGNSATVVSDSIELLSNYTDTTLPPTTPTVITPENEHCPLSMEQAYKYSGSQAVYYITTDCTKRAFGKANVFFTYFTSWNDVELTTGDKLNSIPNDGLGFMPWGPNYDPKYGALVKTVTDPKVYLLLGTEKYWINSEAIFNSLKYSWNWIEDVDMDLLNKYTVGSEINYVNHHPNYTIVKYPNDTKVYRLEPDSTDSTKQVRRHIKDENAFSTFNFRWDRIVTISSDESYDDGEQLSSSLKTNTTVNSVFTLGLEVGDSGVEVEQLQQKLINLGYLDVSATGYFGQATKEAVKKYQTANGINMTWNVGPLTRGKLNSL